MKRLLAIFLSVAVMAAVLCVPVSAASPRGISDFWQRLKFAWGCSDATGVICADCGKTMTFEQLNVSDYCSGCGACLINRFGGFGGGSSRGGGAGRDGTPVVSSDGKLVVYAWPVIVNEQSGVSISGDMLVMDFPAGSSKYVLAYTSYTSGSLYTKKDFVAWYVNVPVDGLYRFLFEFSGSGYRIWDDSVSARNEMNLVSRTDISLGYPMHSSGYLTSASTVISGSYYYYASTVNVRLKAIFKGDTSDYSPAADDLNIDSAEKNLIINESTTVSYTNIYDYGDTYITYDVNNHPTVFVRDDNGQIIGSMAWQDGAYNLQYYNGFSPSVSTGSDSGSDSGSGSGSDSGSDSGSGSGSDPGSDSGDGILGWIMKKIVAAIEGIFKTIGDLIGAVFLGILELIQSVLDNLTQSISLVDGFSDSIASVFDFLPDKYRSILLAGFSCFMLISIFKFMRG